MINNKRLIKEFKKLVKIDSLSLQEGEIISHLTSELKKLGLKPRQAGRPRNGEAGNLIVNVPGRGQAKPNVLLNAHVDTVAPGENIRPIEKKGYITSDGLTVLGADNKSGVAAILEILKTLQEKKLRHPPLKIIFTVAEEIGLAGAKSLLKSLLDVDFGIVLDGGDIDEVIYKAPSQRNISAIIIGRAAHAGLHPEQGINAIRVASAAINKMKLGRIDKETTANIGVIQGGKAANIIPDKVELKGEARSHHQGKLKKQIAHMKKILLDACRQRGAKLNLTITPMYQSFEVKKNARPLQLASAAIRRAGLKPDIKQTGGGSDANIFNAAGIPSIIMGVGADRVHTERERIRISEFIRGTEIVLDLLISGFPLSRE